MSLSSLSSLPFPPSFPSLPSLPSLSLPSRPAGQSRASTCGSCTRAHGGSCCYTCSSMPPSTCSCGYWARWWATRLQCTCFTRSGTIFLLKINKPVVSPSCFFSFQSSVVFASRRFADVDFNRPSGRLCAQYRVFCLLFFVCLVCPDFLLLFFSHKTALLFRSASISTHHQPGPLALLSHLFAFLSATLLITSPVRCHFFLTNCSHFSFVKNAATHLNESRYIVIVMFIILAFVLFQLHHLWPPTCAIWVGAVVFPTIVSSSLLLVAALVAAALTLPAVAFAVTSHPGHVRHLQSASAGLGTTFARPLGLVDWTQRRTHQPRSPVDNRLRLIESIQLKSRLFLFV